MCLMHLPYVHTSVSTSVVNQGRDKTAGDSESLPFIFEFELHRCGLHSTFMWVDAKKT